MDLGSQDQLLFPGLMGACRTIEKKQNSNFNPCQRLNPWANSTNGSMLQIEPGLMLEIEPGQTAPEVPCQSLNPVQCKRLNPDPCLRLNQYGSIGSMLEIEPGSMSEIEPGSMCLICLAYFR